jgi:hypothetical protein
LIKLSFSTSSIAFNADVRGTKWTKPIPAQSAESDPKPTAGAISRRYYYVKRWMYRTQDKNCRLLNCSREQQVKQAREICCAIIRPTSPRLRQSVAGGVEWSRAPVVAIIFPSGAVMPASADLCQMECTVRQRSQKKLPRLGQCRNASLPAARLDSARCQRRFHYQGLASIAMPQIGCTSCSYGISVPT